MVKFENLKVNEYYECKGGYFKGKTIKVLKRLNEDKILMYVPCIKSKVIGIKS